MTKLTSRLPLMDIIELITHLIASASHLQELISADGTTEEEKERYELMLFELVDIRRAIMDQLPKGEKKMWCNVKHAIGQRGYALEIYYAERNLFWNSVVEGLSKIMFQVISEYIGAEITTCGRCLNDQLEVLDNKEDGNDGATQGEG